MTERHLKYILRFPIVICFAAYMLLALPIWYLFVDYDFRDCWQDTIDEIKLMFRWA